MRITAILSHAVLTLLLGIGIGMSAPAQAEKRMALVIGNGAYAVGALANPTNDSNLISASLEWAGFEVTHVQDLDYRALQRSVVEFGRGLKEAGEDTVGLVFYAGHAIQANGENYLIPVDSDIQDELDLDIQALPVSILMRSLEAAGNRLNMVVLDACRNNPFMALTRSGTRGLAKIDAPFGTLLAYSTAPGDVAADGNGRNSPYSAALAKALQIPGLPVEQLFKKVRIEVMEQTGNQQVPWESSSLIGDFYFVPGTAPSAQTTPSQPADGNAEIDYWKAIADSNNPIDFQGYLAAYPNGAFREIAEGRIASLQASQDGQAAQQAWEAAKHSGDATALQAILDRYPGSVYAELAQIKLQTLQQSTDLSGGTNDQASLARGETERLFWESIKDTGGASDYEAYLQRYPNGAFSAIARLRLENGVPVQTASLTPAAQSHPYDGVWTFNWKVVSNFWQGSWCTAGEAGSEVFEMKDGEYEGRIVSNRSQSARFTVETGEDGQTTLVVFTHDWSLRQHRIKLDISSGADTVHFAGVGYCQAEMTLTRS